MKKIIVLIAIFFAAFKLNAQTDAFSVRVEGLGCPFCAYGLEKKFKDVKGIKDIKINIKTGVMTYNVPEKNNMPLSDVDVRVSKAGYTAKEMSVKRANGKVETGNGKKEAVASKEAKTEIFEVSGNCEMCEARIEKAAKAVMGVVKADWNVESKKMTVVFEPSKTKLKDVQNAIAKSGHDNGTFKTGEKTYNDLPACCQYR
jgi:periplasmic mercuric ion binding protein